MELSGVHASSLVMVCILFRMQPISNPGVVSSFFTYTGPSDNNPWDEIDIEFLGKDTTKVQFNYYTNGVGGHEFLYDLGFDASESYHGMVLIGKQIILLGMLTVLQSTQQLKISQ